MDIVSQATLMPGGATDRLPFDRPPPRNRDPDLDDIDRLVSSLDHLVLCCCKAGADKSDEHVPLEAVA